MIAPRPTSADSDGDHARSRDACDHMANERLMTAVFALLDAQLEASAFMVRHQAVALMPNADQLDDVRAAVRDWCAKRGGTLVMPGRELKENCFVYDIRILREGNRFDPLDIATLFEMPDRKAVES